MRRARIKAIPLAPVRKRQLNKPPENELKEILPVQEISNPKVENSALEPEEEILIGNFVVKSVEEPVIEAVSIDNVIVKSVNEESAIDDHVEAPVEDESTIPETESSPDPEKNIFDNLKSPLKQEQFQSVPDTPAEPQGENIELINSSSKEPRELKSPTLVITSPRPTIASPSPTKLIPSRPRLIRPLPKIDGSSSSRIRRNSVQGSGASASESEDDSRRQNGTTLNKKTINNNTGETGQVESLNDNNCSQNTIGIKNKKKKKIVISDSAKKLGEAKREFRRLHGLETSPDKSKMKMYDLIYYNPRNNPMKKPNKPANTQRAVNDTTCPAADDVEDGEDENEENADDPDSSQAGAPQVEFGPNGELIIDSQSLLISTDVEKERKKLSRREDNGDGENRLGGFYKRRQKSKVWSKLETIKFYKALSTFEINFHYMQSFFPDRTVANLKAKFKKEEKVNPALIDKAMSLPCDYDSERLKKDFESIDKTFEEKELEYIKSKDLNKKNEPAKRGRKRKSALPQVDDGNENVEGDKDGTDKPEEIKKRKKTKNTTKNKRNLKKKKNNDNEDDNNDVEDAVDTLVYKAKPTRSGRVAKLKMIKLE